MTPQLLATLEVTKILSESTTMETAAEKILRVVCEILRWDMGAIWIVDAHTESLCCLKTWSAPERQQEIKEFIEATSGRTFSKGIGLPGSVWENNKPLWIEDIVTHDNFPRAPFAARTGLHGAFGFPIRLDTQAIGVIEFFSQELRQPDDDLLSIFASIGNQIGQFTGRMSLEEKLKQKSLELARSNKELEQFASIASHDLKEPLTKIIGFSDRLETMLTSMNEKEKDYFHRIQKAGRRMQTLIDDLLLFSKVSVNSRTFEPVDLNALVHEVLFDLDHLIQKTNAQIERSSLPVLNANGTQMRQLFQNLISNALKYKNESQVPRIRITSTNLNHGQGRVRIEIKDNGIGFDEKYLEKIFGLPMTKGGA